MSRAAPVRRVQVVGGGLAGLAAALGDFRAVLGELSMGEDHLTTEQYTDAVMRART